jgi:peptidoglycan/LPS O-acetylase OafA/YrhL
MTRSSTFSGDSANLDLVRAVAVLSVFGAHAQSVYTNVESITSWRFAQLGVIIFFVHTSMVLMLSLERSEARKESLFGDFYIRRLFRLMPLSMFCVTLAFLFTAPMAGPKHWTIAEYIANLTLTMDLAYMRRIYGITWTLALEMQMYVVLPALFIFARNRRLSALLTVWAVAAVAGYLQPMITGRLNVIEYAPCFIAGVIAWRISLSAPRRLPGWLWPLALVSVWPIFLIASHQNNMFYRWGFCLALGTIIPWFQEMRLGYLNKITHQIAKYSYGVYLSHAPLMYFAFGLPWPRPAQWLFLFAAATVTPILMYHLIEHPLIQVGSRVVAHRKQRMMLKPA